MVRRYFESDFVNPEVKNEFRFWAQETKHDFLSAIPGFRGDFLVESSEANL